MFTLYGMPLLFSLQVFLIEGPQICYVRLVREYKISKIRISFPRATEDSTLFCCSRPIEPVIKPRGNADWKY